MWRRPPTEPVSEVFGRTNVVIKTASICGRLLVDNIILLTSILDAMHSAPNDGKTVYVHCWRNGMCDTLILRWSGILLGILFIAAALSACGGSSAPATQVSGSSTPDEGTTKSTPDTQVQDSSPNVSRRLPDDLFWTDARPD